MAVTNTLNIIEMVVGQSGGENLFNAALRTLDISVFLIVIDKDLTAPPGSETGGEVYIPAATATGTWVGEEDSIAYFDNGYKFIQPIEGMVAYITDEKIFIKYDGTNWVNNSLPKFNVEAKTGNYTVIAAQDIGKLFTNTGAGGTITFSMPAATVGQQYWFSIGAAQFLRIDPDGTETIALPATGIPGAAGKYIETNAICESVHLVCIIAGSWAVYGFTGTWAHEI